MQDLKDLIDSFDFSKLDCFYADLRIEHIEKTTIGYKDGILDDYSPENSTGAFLRVYNNGQWFYKYTTDLSSFSAIFNELIEQSKTFDSKCKDLFKDVPKTHSGSQKFEGINPFSKTALEKKSNLCKEYSKLKNEFKEMSELRLYYGDRYESKFFKSSLGRSFDYDFADCGIAFNYKLKDSGNLFNDSFRCWRQSFEDLTTLESELRSHIEEALKHLNAPNIEPGKYPVVLDPETVGIFTHESFGHKSEADFMLGDSNAKDEWKIGKKVGNPNLSIVDHGGEFNNGGFCPYDDDGFETQKTYLIKGGLLAGRLHSLETAEALDEKPTGNSRAVSFQFEPIVRMTNTYIEPGEESPEEIISSVKDGLFISNPKHGSGLSTFTIAPGRCYRIKDGKIADPVKVSVISGDVFTTLENIEKIGNDFETQNSIFGGCGKDEQWPLRVADGGPTIFVKEMQVG